MVEIKTFANKIGLYSPIMCECEQGVKQVQ